MSKKTPGTGFTKKLSSYSNYDTGRFLTEPAEISGGSINSKTFGIKKENHKSFLESIKRRKNFPQGSEISAGVAAEVVKEYILPMFRYETKSKRNRKRSQDYGLSTLSRLEALSNTTYGELSLSEKLLNELKEFKIKFSLAEAKLKEAIQEKFVIQAELNQALTENVNLKNNLEFFKSNYRQDASHKKLELVKSNLLQYQYEKSLSLNKDNIKSVEELRKKFTKKKF